jgi:hypothetical protein
MSVRAGLAVMDTTAVALDEAAAIEAAEVRAWADMYAATPHAFAQRAGIDVSRIGGAIVLRWRATGRRYFSRVVGLGVLEPATPHAIDQILAHYARHGISMFLLQSLPHCRPAEYEGLLRARGLEPFDAQDRIVRGGEPLGAELLPTGALTVERVDAAGADEWAAFLQRVYRLDTGPWLQLLVGRPGWHQYVARLDGEIVAARGMYLDRGGIAWLGMDGPVPGITTHDYEPDAAICARIVDDGLARGARAFAADIEAPSPSLDTPAYENFAALGFSRPYVRTHWTH